MNPDINFEQDNPPLTLGTWMSIGSPVIAELASLSGFNWLLFDMEHGNMPEAALLSNLQAVTTGGAQPIVRVPSLNPDLISRVLDWGAAGIMLPHVNRPEMITGCLQAMNYPPLGKRGYSGSARQYHYGIDLATNQIAARPKLIAQIEDVEAIDNIDAIASVKGVDVLFVGPSDLQLALRHQARNPITYAEAIEKISKAAKKYQVQAGILVKDSAETDQYLSKGFSCIAVLSDIAILRSAYQRLVSSFRDSGSRH